MRIRVEGTETEITAVIERLAEVLDIQDASDFHPNRRRGEKYLPAGSAPNRPIGRVYLTVDVLAESKTVRAAAARDDLLRALPKPGRKEIR